MKRHAAWAAAAAILGALAAAPVAAAWTWPVRGPVLEAFSFDPAHPYAPGQHRGIAIRGEAGAPVVAPASGAVTFVGPVPSNGLSVTIVTPDGLAVSLTHLGGIAVARGAAVSERDVVGTVGSDAASDFGVPYVHLGIRTASEPEGYLDPLGFLPPLGPPAPPAGDAPAPVASPAVAAPPPPPATPVAQPAPPVVQPVPPVAQPVPSLPVPPVQPSPSPVPAVPSAAPPAGAPVASVLAEAPLLVVEPSVRTRGRDVAPAASPHHGHVHAVATGPVPVAVPDAALLGTRPGVPETDVTRLLDRPAWRPDRLAATSLPSHAPTRPGRPAAADGPPAAAPDAGGFRLPVPALLLGGCLAVGVALLLLGFGRRRGGIGWPARPATRG